MPDMDFRSWVLESYTPVVMVVASPAVEAAVQQRNGLTIADLLRPSGYFHHLSGTLPAVQNPCACRMGEEICIPPLLHAVAAPEGATAVQNRWCEARQGSRCHGADSTDLLRLQCRSRR